MEQAIQQALGAITTEGGNTLPESGMLSDVILRDEYVAFTLNAGADIEQANALKAACEEALAPLLDGKKLLIAITNEAATAHGAEAHAAVPPPLIAIGSGKGGVGKSTITANIACALAAKQVQMGVIDADIYGPSQPYLLGIEDKPEAEGQLLKPVSNHEVACLSVGMLVPEEEALIWRGPMVTKMLSQLFAPESWKDKELLLADLPPGTGDVPLTIAKNFGLSGALLVTLPNKTAWLDVQKAISMFRKLNTPIIGVVNNMAYVRDAKSGTKLYPYGTMDIKLACAEMDVPFLGDIPMTPSMHDMAGTPYVLGTEAAADADEVQQAYHQLADKLMDWLGG